MTCMHDMLRSGKLDPDEDVQVQVTFQAWIKGGINRCFFKKRDQQSSFNMYIYDIMYMYMGISYQTVKGIFDNPHPYIYILGFNFIVTFCMTWRFATCSFFVIFYIV